jgi:hypothetical protein
MHKALFQFPADRKEGKKGGREGGREEGEEKETEAYT